MSALAWGLPAAWLATFAVHGTFLLGAAWLIARRLERSAGHPRSQELLWRLATLGAWCTTTLQVFWLPHPWAGHWLAVAAGEGESAAGVRGELGSFPAALFGDLPPAELPASAAGGAGGGDATLALLVLGVALAGAVFGLLRHVRSRQRLRRLLAGRQPVVAGPLPALLGQWTKGRGLRVRLSRSESLASPIAFGVLRPEICLPAAVEALPPSQQRAILAHECAHLERRDPLWLGLAALHRILFWWQPLFAVAHRRQQCLAEFGCDALAAARTGAAPLAGALVEVASWTAGDRRLPGGALAMALSTSALRARIDRLLAGAGPQEERRLTVWGAGLLGLLLAAAGLPGAAWREASGALPPRAGRSTPAPEAALPSVRAFLDEFDRERALLSAELDGLRTELAALPEDHELRVLWNRLQERAARLDRMRRALDAWLHATTSADETDTDETRGER